MRPRLSAVLAVALMAGCLAPEAAEETDQPPAPPLTGLFTAGDSGLEAVEALPGLARTAAGEETTYAWDALATIEDNRLQLLLLEVHAATRIRMTLQAHVVYDDVAPPASERRTPPATCFQSWATNVTSGGGAFVVDRALGLPGTPPAEDREGGHPGPGLGRGHGAVGALVNLGSPYDATEVGAGDLPAGGWMMFETGVSQSPVASLRADGNRWWMNWTVSGPHRIVAVPAAPMYCHFGFGEADDPAVFVEQPVAYIEGARLDEATRYGTTVVVEHVPGTMYDAVQERNEAVVDLFGTRCLATAERAVAVTTFAAGDVGLEVTRWHGYPRFLLIGLGPLPSWDFLAYGAGAPSCPAP